ncbi:MAG TPA: bifunctional folylpolyglutamate synthase/dihydrofolate synthase, partial [Luteimonas sp.]|nr:bifunctional folylpolyglutamate synthase/dihydrofolate synthase [Luteimonas sp.]
DDAGPRGLDADAFVRRLAGSAAEAGEKFASVGAALAAALGGARTGDRVLVFGSFHTVAAALRVLQA